MKKRYAVIAGIACVIPFGSALAASGASSEAAASWATMDADGDGALSPEEVSGTPWEAKFDQMNSNGDGKVTKAEFEKYMQSMKKAQKKEHDDNM